VSMTPCRQSHGPRLVGVLFRIKNVISIIESSLSLYVAFMAMTDTDPDAYEAKKDAKIPLDKLLLSIEELRDDLSVDAGRPNTM
jgi:hypothetical protein